MEEKIQAYYESYMNDKLAVILREDAGTKFKTKLGFKPFLSCVSFRNFSCGYAAICKYDLRIPKYTFINEAGQPLINELFDRVTDFKDNLAIVEKNGKVKIINTKGKYILNKWYKSISEFNGKFAVVQDEASKFNFVDREGNFISDNWFSKVNDFSEGMALVKVGSFYKYINEYGKPINCFLDIVQGEDFKEGYAAIQVYGGKYYYINRRGDLLNYHNPYQKAYSFSDGVGRVILNNKNCFIGRDGNKLFNKTFYAARDYHEGFALVQDEKNSGWYFIDKDGLKINDEVYDEASDFKDGIALVKSNNMYYYINKSGKKFSKRYSKASEFKEGYAIVEEKDSFGGRYHYIDKRGTTIGVGYFSAKPFENGLALVEKIGGFNYLKTNGDYLLDTCYPWIGPFHDGYAIVRNKDHKYNFIDMNGDLQLEEWLSFEINDFINEYAALSLNEKYNNYIDKNGVKMYAVPYIPNPYLLHRGIISSTFNPIPFDRIPEFADIDYKHYKVKPAFFKKEYKISDESDRFNIQYLPIKIFNNNYIVCLKDDNNSEVYLLYDRKNDIYKVLGDIDKVVFDDNFIFTQDEILLVYGYNLLNVTKYFEEHPFNGNEISITPNIDVLSEEDFKVLNHDKFLKEEKEENRKLREQQDKVKLLNDLKMAEDERERLINENRLKRAKLLSSIEQSLLELKDLYCGDEYVKTDKIDANSINGIFIEVDGHKEIPCYIRKALKEIDLSGVDFRNVNIQGIDFRGTNATHIFPESVYNKDLRNCNFTGIYLEGFRNFKGVDIRGAKFSKDNDPKTFDFMPVFTGAIYDENTTYNGIPLTELIGPCKELEDKEILYGNNRI